MFRVYLIDYFNSQSLYPYLNQCYLLTYYLLTYYLLTYYLLTYYSHNLLFLFNIYKYQVYLFIIICCLFPYLPIFKRELSCIHVITLLIYPISIEANQLV